MDFNGKVAIVTGGAQGIGKAYCSALLDVGMKVCICDINEKAAKEFIKNLPDAQQKNAIFQKCDVSKVKEFKDAFDKVISVFERVDLVVNNAGIFNEHEWQKVVDVNFVGVIHGIKLGFEYMSTERGGYGGLIVNTASNAGFKGFDIAPVYSGSKHGVIGLTRSYGTETHFKQTGVKVCAVCPGPVDTALFHGCASNCIDEEAGKQHNAKLIPIKPEIVADALMKILKDGKNGSFLRVDDTGCQYTDH